MPDRALTITGEFVRGNEWALEAAATSAGGEAAFALPSTVPVQIRGMSIDLRIRGMTIFYAGAVKQILPQVYSSYSGALGQVAHYLTDYTNTVNFDSQSYFPLDIPVRLGAATDIVRVVVAGGTGALDALMLSLWGEFFTPQALEQPVQPVRLQEFVWPLKTRRF